MSEEAPPPPVATASATPRTAPLAIVSLVLAILSCVFVLSFPIGLPIAITAIVCGYVARSNIRKSAGALRGMGIAFVGLIVGYVGLAVALVFVTFATIMLVDMIRSDRERLHDLAIKRQEIVSDDGKLKVTASGFWVKRTDLNQHASLQAACPSKDLYVVVITDQKSTVGDMTLQQRHQMTSDHKLKQMTNASSTAPVSLTINGQSALQDEVSGTEKGKVLILLHTTVDDGDNFRQIIAWTSKSRWAANKSELAEITNSFHSEK